MNLIKVAARGPAPWASEPVSQQPGPLRAKLGCLLPVLIHPQQAL